MYLKGKPDLDEPLYDSVKPFRKPKTSTLERQWKAIDQRDSPKNPKPQTKTPSLKLQTNGLTPRNPKPEVSKPQLLDPKTRNPKALS